MFACAQVLIMPGVAAAPEARGAAEVIAGRVSHDLCLHAADIRHEMLESGF